MTDGRRSLESEGAVFWLCVGAVIPLAATAATGLHLIPSLAVAGINGLLAALCWSQRRIAFAISAAFSLLIAVAAFPFLFGGEETPTGALVDALVITSALWVVFLSLQVLRQTNGSTA